ncbi:MAG: hypothetical protein EPN57_15170 [Paraburkholderia sp.]|nr:MAG: hypothetical protein EPN57_15170 [Paraburkholderia sp.]
MKQALARRVGDTRSLKRLSYGRTTSAFQRLASSPAAERSRWAVTTSSLIVSAGIVGATVMPHALFLHSGLTGERVRPRTEEARAKLVRYSNAEVVVALTVAASGRREVSVSGSRGG